MSYKIAIATSDGVNINESFGAAKVFHIYEVTDGSYVKTEERNVSDESAETALAEVAQTVESCSDGGNSECSEHGTQGCNVAAECGIGKDSGCGTGGGCSGGGCSSGAGASPKVELISDCRCVVCKKAGFHIQKQLERKAITIFDVSCTVEEALKKISFYFNRIDNHVSLRGISK